VCLRPSLWKLVGYSYSLQKLQNLFHSIPLALANQLMNLFFSTTPEFTNPKQVSHLGVLTLCAFSVGCLKTKWRGCHPWSNACLYLAVTCCARRMCQKKKKERKKEKSWKLSVSGLLLLDFSTQWRSLRYLVLLWVHTSEQGWQFGRGLTCSGLRSLWYSM
jgi:hypothetical protein